MGCLFRLFRVLLIAAVVLVALILFLPRFFAQAGNSAINSNSTTGVAELIPAGALDKNNKLEVSLSGLSAGKKYEVTLDPGVCGNSGSIDVGLVTADASGNVNATFSVASLNVNNQTWFVDVHDGPSATAPTLACSQLITNSTSADASANNTTIQLSPGTSNANVTISQSSSGSTSSSSTNTNTPQGFPNTGVVPGSNNSYDNNAYPRKF